MLWCEECVDWFLRSQRHDHEHELVPEPGFWDDDDDTEDTGPDEDPEEVVGGVFDVTVYYEYTMRVRVAAACKSDAREQAETIWASDSEDLTGTVPRPHMTQTLHKDVHKLKEIQRQDEDLAEEMPGWPW